MGKGPKGKMQYKSQSQKVKKVYTYPKMYQIYSHCKYA